MEMEARLSSESTSSTSSTNSTTRMDSRESRRSWLYAVIYAIQRPFRVLNSVKISATPVSTRLTREGFQVVFMAAFALLGAVLQDVNLLIILAGALLGLLLIQWRVCGKTLHGLTTQRRLPRSMSARRSFEIELSISNPKRWLGSWLVLAQDRMVFLSRNETATPVSQGIGLLYGSIPPKSSRVQKYRCIVERRGKYQFLGIELTTRFPMGLMRGILPPKSAESFIVQPLIGRLLPSWGGLFDVHNSSAKQRRTKSTSDEGDFFGLRAYRAGDSPRWIHWRSSARRDELVVKQFQREDSRELVILLDLFRTPQSGKEVVDAIANHEDLAVEFVATIVSQIASSNSGVITVAIADAEPVIASRVQSRSTGSGMLDRLGVATHGEGEEIFAALQLLEKDFRRIEHLIVVSTRPRIDLLQQSGESGAVVFWRSLTWLDAAAGDLTKYFARGEQQTP